MRISSAPSLVALPIGSWMRVAELQHRPPYCHVMSSTPEPTQAASAAPSERTAAEEWLGTKPQKPGLAHRIAAVWKDEYDTVMNWPRGKRHLVTRGLVVLIVNTIALLIVAELMNGITLHRRLLGGRIAVAAFVTFAAWHHLPGTAGRLRGPGHQQHHHHGVLTVVFMGADPADRPAWFVARIQIDGFLVAFIASILIAAINTVLVAIIGLDEDESFFRHSIKRMARVEGDVDDRPGPGFVILQIDGLAEPVLRDALRTGYMPFLNDWLTRGLHIASASTRRSHPR